MSVLVHTVASYGPLVEHVQRFQHRLHLWKVIFSLFSSPFAVAMPHAVLSFSLFVCIFPV